MAVGVGIEPGGEDPLVVGGLICRGHTGHDEIAGTSQRHEPDLFGHRRPVQFLDHR